MESRKTNKKTPGNKDNEIVDILSSIFDKKYKKVK
jgi:hypothetical protein